MGPFDMPEPRSGMERLFDSSYPGSVFGALGSAFGNRSQAQYSGDVNGQAMANLAQLREQGLPPEQAIMKFIQSPEGQKWMGSGAADVKGTLDMFVKQTLPQPDVATSTPAGGKTTFSSPVTNQPTRTITNAPNETQNFNNGVPMINNIPAGASQTNTTPGGTTRQGQPTTDLQNFTGFAALSNMEPDAIRELATYQAMPQDMRAQKMQERALYALVNSGKLDAETAQKLIGGLLTLQEGTNQMGEKNGTFFVIDKTQMGPNGNPVVNVITPRGGQQPGTGIRMPGQPGQQGGAPGGPAANGPIDQGPRIKVPRDALKPDGSIDWSKVDDKNTMFLGSSVSSTLTSGVSRLFEMVDPALDQKTGIADNSRAINRQMGAQNQLRQAIVGLTENSTNLGTPKAIIESAQNLVEGLPGTGGNASQFMPASPKAQMEHAIQLHTMLSNAMQSDMNIYNAANSPKEQKQKAYGRLTAYQRILDALPDPDVQKQLLQDYLAGNSGNQGLLPTAKNLLDAGRKAFTSTTQQAQDVIGSAPLPRARPGEAPKAQGGIDFGKMSPDDLIAVDPKSVTDPAQKQIYMQRLNDIINAPAPSGPGGATPFSQQGTNMGPPAGRFSGSNGQEIPGQAQAATIPQSQNNGTPSDAQRALKSDPTGAKAYYQGKTEVIKNATLGPDGNYYMMRNNQLYRVVPVNEQNLRKARGR